jgi:hypothetical protein
MATAHAWIVKCDMADGSQVEETFEFDFAPTTPRVGEHIVIDLAPLTSGETTTEVEAVTHRVTGRTVQINLKVRQI